MSTNMDCEIHISPQYLQKQHIEVTVLKIINPAHFIVKETPRKFMSEEAKQFLILEDKIKHFYNSFEPVFSQLPSKGSIVIVQPERDTKWFRARVNSILDSTNGPCVSVYLVDYGRICKITRNCLYTICEDFLEVPFQAVEFKLLGLKPAGYSSNLDMTLRFGRVSKWDTSAKEYVTNLWKEMTNAQIEVFGLDQVGCLYGNLHIQKNDYSFCLNEELLKDDYAVLIHDESPKVFSLEEKLDVQCQDNAKNIYQGLKCENSLEISLENRAEMEKEAKKQFKEELEIFRKNLKKREDEVKHENKFHNTSVAKDKFKKLLHAIKAEPAVTLPNTEELKQNIYVKKKISDIKEMQWSSAMQNSSDSGHESSSENKVHMLGLSSVHAKTSFHNENQVSLCDNTNDCILNKQATERNGFTRTGLENSKPSFRRFTQNVNNLENQTVACGLKKNEDGSSFSKYFNLQGVSPKNITSEATLRKKTVDLNKFAKLKKQISKPHFPQTNINCLNTDTHDEKLSEAEAKRSSSKDILSNSTPKVFLSKLKKKPTEAISVASELPSSTSVPTEQYLQKTVNICSQKVKVKGINKDLGILSHRIQDLEKRELKVQNISLSSHIQADQTEDESSILCNSSDVLKPATPESLSHCMPAFSASSKSKTMTSSEDPFKKLQRLIKQESVRRETASECAENMSSPNMCSITEVKEADQVAFKLNDPEDLLEGIQKNEFKEQERSVATNSISDTLLNSETSEQSETEQKQIMKNIFSDISNDAQERILPEEFYDENVETSFFKTNLVL